MIWYPLIFFGVFFEGEFTLVLAGFGVVSLGLWMPGVALIAAVAGFLGDWFFYELGRSRGEVVQRRWPKLVRRGMRLTQLFSKFPSLFLFILRFQIGMRMVGNFSIGMGGHIEKKRYLFLNSLACVVWAVAITVLCFYFAQIMSALFSMSG